MSSMVVPAIRHMFFALAFILLVYLQDYQVVSEIKRTVVDPLLKSQWQVNPSKTIYDIKNGNEVHKWLDTVFLNQLYAGVPQNGADKEYCSSTFPCLLSEGNAKTDAQCSGAMKAGDRNCPMPLGSKANCCKPCQGQDCAPYGLATKGGFLKANSSIFDLSAACSQEVPNYLAQLSLWKATDRPDLANIQATYCPERLSKVDAQLFQKEKGMNRPLLVGLYNRIVMGRISLKRRVFAKSQSKPFFNAYPQILSQERIYASSFNGDAEDTTSFGKQNQYSYSPGGGYNQAGAFVQHLDFDRSKNYLRKQLAAIQRDFWFDLAQGSFAIEMLAYSGNVNKLAFIDIVFEHDFSGRSKVSVSVKPLNLSLHDGSKPENIVRIILYFVVLICYILFCKTELEEMSAGYGAYFSSPLTISFAVLMVLCLYCIVQYVCIVFSNIALNFTLPMPADAAVKQQQFQDLAYLAASMDVCMVAMSFNTALICLQAIVLMTCLAPQWSIIFDTLHRMKSHIIAFYAVLFTLFIGFALSGMFLFGLRMPEFDSFLRSCITVVQMLSAEANLEQLREADQEFGYGFFVAFHILLLIFTQILISILINGYMEERQALANSTQSDAFPLRRIMVAVKGFITQYGSFIRRCLASLSQLFFSGQSGGAQRVDYDHVARLSDARATKPRFRTVLYEQRSDDAVADAKDGYSIHEDIRLRAVEPFYPDGMMHLYVQSISPDGPAKDGKVQTDFRLVCIQAQGAVDRERFRDYSNFKLHGNPQKILEDLSQSLPVRLDFQGRVRPISLECIVLLLFCSLFLSFAISVCRISDSFSLAQIHSLALAGPTWNEYNPTAVESFSSTRNQHGITKWLQSAIIDQELSCVTDLGGRDCKLGSKTDQMRDGWALWSRSGTGNLPSAYTSSVGHLVLSPDANVAEVALSLGMLPNQKGNLSSKVRSVVRFKQSNVGAMMNNHVRLTIQTACFQRNADPRFARGYVWILDPVLTSATSGCTDTDCMRQMMKSGRVCYTRGGDVLKDAMDDEDTSDIPYAFAQNGTYLNLGGFAVGLGNTRFEAKQILDLLNQDVRTPVSMVFEFVSYNGNTDLFSYVMAKFNFKSTGLLEKEVTVDVFPLNIFSVGMTDDNALKVKTNFALFACYLVSTVLFTLLLIKDILLQFAITKALQRPWYLFLWDHLMDDRWNVIDIVSVALNICLINSITRFILIDGSYTLKDGFRSWTMDYAFPSYVSLKHVDPYFQFSQAALTYQEFRGLSGINGFFLLVRFTKYFRSFTSLRLMMSAVAACIEELFVMIVIIIVVMLAFVVALHTRLGIMFERYSSLPLAAQELFLALVNIFTLQDVYEDHPFFFAFVFILYEMIFLLVLNVFLASIVFRWKDTRRDAEEFSITASLQSILDTFRLEGLLKTQRTDQDRRREISEDFWQQLSVLRHLANLQDNGKIVIPPEATRDSRTPHKHIEDEGKDTAEEELEGSDAGSDKEQEGAFNFERPEDRKRFIKTFKKAHMEMASLMCRAVSLKDKGAGVGFDVGEDADKLENESENSALAQLEEDEPMVGIIEGTHSDQAIQDITKNMNSQLEESDRLAEEIWLDALVTVLEEAEALQKLQQLFLPMPMILPKTAQEWNIFYARKKKMERRLNIFLGWLQEEAKIKQHHFLKEMSVSKERVLKQQSLVLADYLQTLDEEVEKLQEEIKVLERKNAAMKMHVSPLL
jgi:hypothetical protein